MLCNPVEDGHFFSNVRNTTSILPNCKADKSMSHNGDFGNKSGLSAAAGNTSNKEKNQTSNVIEISDVEYNTFER